MSLRQGAAGHRVTKEGFQAEPLLLADPDAGVRQHIIENLGKGVRSSRGVWGGAKSPPTPACNSPSS